MSARATAWAWQKIQSNPGMGLAAKLVLLKFADRADDLGLCWPGHERTASDCNLSARGVQKAVSELSVMGLVRIVRRKDAAGRTASNRYFLNLEERGVAPRSTPHEFFGEGEGESCSTPMEQEDDTGSNPVPPKLKGESKTTTTNLSSQKESNVVVSDLIYPTQISQAERNSIQAVLGNSGMDVSKWQAVLDELTGAMLNRTIANPVGFLRGIVKRAVCGTFILERGIAVAHQRGTREVQIQEEAKIEKAFKEKQLPIDVVLGRLPAATSAFLSRKICDGGLK